MATLPADLRSIVVANSTIYQALLTEKSVRIAQLHPGIEDEPVSCSLAVVDLAHAGPFEALSYCWGSEAAEETILCNGKPFRPTRNLLAALKQLRLASKSRRLWIDAICINQNSNVERNQQVALMRQIYQTATHVIVWLGVEDQTTALALETIRIISKNCHSLWSNLGEHEERTMEMETDEQYWRALRVDLVRKVVPQWPDDPRTCASALKTFFQRPWFSRVWVIQEVQAGVDVTVHIGITAIAWNIIASAAIWVVYAPSDVTFLSEPYKFGGFLHADLMQQQPFTTQDDVPFLELLDRCRAFKCSIEKDRIFALLQHPVARLQRDKTMEDYITKVYFPTRGDLDRDASHFGLKVNYNFALFDIYRHIVLRSISEAHSLQVLIFANEASKHREHYPTWMPVWHAPGSARHIGPRRTFLYNASRDYEPRLRTFSDPKLLGLSGLVVGTVVQTSVNIILSDRKALPVEGLSHGASLAELYKISRLIVRDCWQSEDNWLQEGICRTSSQPIAHFADFCAFVAERLYQTSGPTLISLHGKWCDICSARHIASPANGLNDLLEILHCDVCYDFDICVKCHKDGHTCPGQHELTPRPIPSLICELNEHTHSVLAEHKITGNAKRFDTGARQTFDGTCFVKLDNDLLGVTPDSACDGDLVVVFFGSRVPFVVREHKTHSVLLGECYVHGIMDGESVDEWRYGRLEEKDFVLA